MSIEPMVRVSLAVGGGEGEELRRWLYGRRQVHLAPGPGLAAGGEPVPAATLGDLGADSQVRMAALDRVLTLAGEHRGRPSLLDSLFPTRLLATPDELRRAGEGLDPGALAAEADELRQGLADAARRARELRERAQALEGLAGLPVATGPMRAGRFVRMALARPTQAQERRLRKDLDLEIPCGLAWLPGKDSPLAVAFRPADEATVREAFEELGVALEDLPDLPVPPGEAAAQARREAEGEDARRQELRSRCRDLAGRTREFELARARAEAGLGEARGAALLARTRRLMLAGGWLRARELSAFRQGLAARFPASVLVAEDARPGEDVPVALRHGPLLRPLRLLVEMYGLPAYGSLDPTPAVALVFLLFFGIMYGDVVYGLGLVGLAGWLYRRFRDHESLRGFFALLAYGGASAALFGALTGSWAADLPDPRYLGAGNWLQVVRQALAVFDPLEKPVAGLLLVVAVGVANQYLGVILKAWQDARKGRWRDGVLDGVLWVAFFSALLPVVAALFVPVAGGVLRPAGWAAGIAALGLVLSQGRHEAGIVGRLVVGTVSLYGILGTYGFASFVGDVLSYSRLLALGLTTTIVGVAFNILAGLVREVPVAGAVLFVLVLAAGHGLNFAVSVLGAFVHGVRLVFLEFFGRFYESGGAPFAPYGFASERVELADG